MEKELKTLKDLRGHGKEVRHPDFSDCINYDAETSGYDIDKIIDLLKEEAIKRIKVCDTNVKIYQTEELKDHFICGTDNKLCNVCKKDIWFNNLTEEDLE